MAARRRWRKAEKPVGFGRKASRCSGSISDREERKGVESIRECKTGRKDEHQVGHRLAG
jgi:hypothetical protein